jgi:GTP-binding protein Era
MMKKIDEMDFDEYKSGYVALVGKPNVGKSTLLNHYIGQKIAAVSVKPQTTRRRQLGILTEPGAQIIFVDTPGMHDAQYKLSQFINEEARFAFMDADVILFIADASQPPDAEDRTLAAEISKNVHNPKILLVLNKVDLISAAELENRREAYSALMDFDDRISISAIKESGRRDLLDKIIQMLPEGPQYYPEDQITTTYEREIAEDLIRAAALHYLREEVPYGIFVRVEDYKERAKGKRYVRATILVERDSHKGIVIGRRGSMLKQIGTLAREEIEEMSGEEIFLDLKVKVEKNWRNDPDFLRRYGLSHD